MRYTKTPYAQHQFIDTDGKAVGDLPPWMENSEQLLRFYRTMTLIRLFDKRVVALQRTGQMGT
ncbi:MAG TPA: pyruvate dehydrogenase (acetyl-transferring) E1 component subunit alpha, partial [Candidatus Kapabacteria bacterium]|nr:pyruvate dehydrogenase (acetyl-transferring) E1 component subunit alpha [Candidatus Kapabacteria bacterium]